jgi:hypothetical protein
MIKNLGEVMFDYMDIRKDNHYYIVNGDITKSEDLMKQFKNHIYEKKTQNDVLRFISNMKETSEYYCIVQKYMIQQGYRVVGPYKDYNKVLCVYYDMHIPSFDLKEDPNNESWD